MKFGNKIMGLFLTYISVEAIKISSRVVGLRTHLIRTSMLSASFLLESSFKTVTKVEFSLTDLISCVEWSSLKMSSRSFK